MKLLSNLEQAKKSGMIYTSRERYEKGFRILFDYYNNLERSEFPDTFVEEMNEQVEKKLARLGLI